MSRSRRLSEPPTPPPKDTCYSNLEVDYPRWLENDGRAAPIVGLDPQEEKIIGYNDGKIIDASDEKNLVLSDVGKQALVAETLVSESESPLPTAKRRIFGLSRRMFFVLLVVVLVLLIAAIVGGGVGGTLAAHNRAKAATTPMQHTLPATRPSYANTGLAAMQWIDLNESAWDNSTAFNSTWNVNTITDAVKPSTPIAAVAGYPHASHNYSLVKNVYYMALDNKLVERQAPSNSSQAWEDDNFSGLYTASNATFLTAYWNQNIQNVSEELVVLFQSQDFANGITQGRYTSNSTTSNPWVAQNFGFSQPQGAVFAMSLVSYRSGKHLELYTVDDSNSLQQHEYTISDTDFAPGSVVSLTSSSATGITVQPRSPLAVVAQDNQPLYAAGQLPQCTQDTPLTNMILFTVPDASSLVLKAWNCSTGFLDQTAAIAPLQKPNTTYLSLAAMSDKATDVGNVYIMYDSGNGPLVEEWTVPMRAGDPWVISRNVTIDLVA